MVSKQQAWPGHKHRGREVGLGTVLEGPLGLLPRSCRLKVAALECRRGDECGCAGGRRR